MNEDCKVKLHSKYEKPVVDVFGDSKKLLASVRGYDALKTLYFRFYDEDDEVGKWVTDCSNAWEIEEEKIIWWCYAEEARKFIEENS